MNLHYVGWLNGTLRKHFRDRRSVKMRMTKPDWFVFVFCLVVGALVSSDESSNRFLNLWHGLILGSIFLGLFKFFKAGIFK